MAPAAPMALSELSTGSNPALAPGGPPGPPWGMAVNPHVSARAVLARLVPREVRPVLGALPPGDAAVLRCPLLDRRLLVDVVGAPVPHDLLRTASQRARAVAADLPPEAVLYGQTALWVHTGDRPPERLAVIVPERIGAWRSIELHRGRMPPWDVVVLDGVRCTTLVRAVVDVARVAPPARAVEALLAARNAGYTRAKLHMVLNHCLGGAAAGRPRARDLIDAVFQDEQDQPAQD